MLQAAARSDSLAAVVSDGAGTRSLSRTSTTSRAPASGSASFLAAKTVAVALFSDTAPPPKLTDLVPRIAPTPLLLIWAPSSGGEDMNPTYYRLAGRPKASGRFPRRTHPGNRCPSQGIRAPRRRLLRPGTPEQRRRKMTSVPHKFVYALLAAPLLWLVPAFLHPMGEPYAGIADEADMWIFVPLPNWF